MSDIELTIRENDEFVSIIALERGKHNSSIGGCRYINYENLNSAIQDAIELAKAMSKKVKVLNLPYNGGKSVVINKNGKFNSKEIAEFINSLNGRYITGCDVGTSVDKMLEVKKYSKYVSGLPLSENSDELSSFTAKSTFKCLEFVAKNILNKDLSNCSFLIQGLGKVGSELVDILIEKNIKISVTDIDKNKINNFKDNKLITVLDAGKTLTTKIDILVPCALGGIIKENNFNTLECKVICGPANNQLEKMIIDSHLFKNNIFYIPDYLVGSGGVFFAATSYDYPNRSKEQIENDLLSRLDEILEKTFIATNNLKRSFSDALEEIINE